MTDEFEKFRAEWEIESARIGYETDVIALEREAGMWQPAYRCPKCGRFAHVEAGNPTEHYWIITDCTKCGRWENRKSTTRKL